jgi:gamma-glutamylcyclotransferase (GGCT)/AIG2-like uncharacterized protein YtfP
MMCCSHSWHNSTIMTPPSTYHLFVYGSLRQGFQHPAYAYMSKYFNFVGPATACGVLYDLGEYPAARPGASAADVLHGELYAIKNVPEFDWAIAQIDDYEGINPEEGPSLFVREAASVQIFGTNTTAWVYWYNLPIGQATVVPGGDVLAYFREKNKA